MLYRVCMSSHRLPETFHPSCLWRLAPLPFSQSFYGITTHLQERGACATQCRELLVFEKKNLRTAAFNVHTVRSYTRILGCKFGQRHRNSCQKYREVGKRVPSECWRTHPSRPSGNKRWTGFAKLDCFTSRGSELLEETPLQLFSPPCRATPPCRSAASPSFSSPKRYRHPWQRKSLRTSGPFFGSKQKQQAKIKMVVWRISIRHT